VNLLAAGMMIIAVNLKIDQNLGKTAAFAAERLEPTALL
jgi:hypothetical protein